MPCLSLGNGASSAFRNRQLGHPGQFALEEPRPLLYHNEPIWRDSELVGRLTSGAYGHSLGRAVGMGYVEHAGGVSPAWIEGGRYELEVAGRRVPATASLRAFYDPGGERMRG